MVIDNSQNSLCTANPGQSESRTTAQHLASLESHTGFSLHDILPMNLDDLSLGVHLQYVPLDKDDTIQEITVYTNKFSAARTNQNVLNFLRSLQEIRDTPSASMKAFEAKTNDLVHRNKVSESGFSAHLLNGVQSVAAERSAGIRTICLGDFIAESERYQSPNPAVATLGEGSDPDSDDLMTGFEKRKLDQEVDGCLYAL